MKKSIYLSLIISLSFFIGVSSFAAGATTIQPWTPSGTYTQGNQVIYDGSIYQANWWTQSNPSTNFEIQGNTGYPWTLIGPANAQPQPQPQPQPQTNSSNFAIAVTGTLNPGDSLTVNGAMGNCIATYSVIKNIGIYQGYNVYSFSLINDPAGYLEHISTDGYNLWDNNTIISSSSYTKQTQSFNNTTYQLFLPSVNNNQIVFNFAVATTQTASTIAVTFTQPDINGNISKQMIPTTASLLPDSNAFPSNFQASNYNWEKINGMNYYGLEGGYNVPWTAETESNNTAGSGIPYSSVFSIMAGSQCNPNSLIKSVSINGIQYNSFSISQMTGGASGATNGAGIYDINL